MVHGGGVFSVDNSLGERHTIALSRVHRSSGCRRIFVYSPKKGSESRQNGF